MRTGGRPILGHHHMLGLWESSLSGYQWPKPHKFDMFFQENGWFSNSYVAFLERRGGFSGLHRFFWSFVRHFLAPFSGSKKYHVLMVWCRMIIRRWLQVLWGSAVLHLSTTRISIPDEDEDWAKSGSRALSEKKRQAPWKWPWWNGWNDGQMSFETMEIWCLFSDKAPSWFLRITSQRRKRSERPTWWFFEKQERWDGRTKHRYTIWLFNIAMENHHFPPLFGIDSEDDFWAKLGW